MKTLDKIIELLTKLLPIAGLFAALMYFVGRMYISRYYDTMGVPSGILGFGTTDYVFEGAHPWRIIIVLIFTLLGVLLFRFGIPASFPWADDIKDQPKLLWTEMKALYAEVRKETKTLNNAVGFFSDGHIQLHMGILSSDNCCGTFWLKDYRPRPMCHTIFRGCCWFNHSNVK